MSSELNIISWNVNGVRACYKKGLLNFIENKDPDILCLQETKAQVEQVPQDMAKPFGMHSYWSSAVRKGYSGTATFSKTKATDFSKGIGIEEFDSEGRFTITTHPDFKLYNIYFPNGSHKPERQIYKMNFNKAILSKLKQEIKNGQELIVVGDYNIAPEEIDIYDPERFSNVSGFLPEERQWFRDFKALGFVDTFRQLHPEAKDIYSWWNMIRRDRLSNRGWRIDLICVTKNLASRLTHASIMDTQEGSDHCPVAIGLECF